MLHYKLDLIETVELVVNAEFFQSDLADDVELSASSDESVEPLSLSKENEAEDVNPQQNEIQLGDFDEEEHTSDQDESDTEDDNVEFDISPTSEDEMETIWFEDDVRLLQVGGERVVGGDLIPFLHLHHRQQRNHRFTEHSDLPRARSAWTTTTRANFKHLMYNVQRNAERICASIDRNQWKERGPVWMRKEYCVELCEIWMETQLKRPPHFHELFDQTHKKKETDDYISERAREVAESYSRGMEERYGDDSQCPELDPDIWVAAYEAPRKGHMYGFGHSLGTAMVISSCSSSVSHATSPFTTPAALDGSSSDATIVTPAQFREIVNEIVSQNISHIVSQTVS
ncbi:hypothetical protein Taro_039907 [Colocasia esculenta]|uniref:Uncharacterized protein n=1 Tax=Colocasia esculenta TaxID=4460 RepID=A0A843WAH6_COLES|nr:hypothetical protein [Colocasia esculenta]